MARVRQYAVVLTDGQLLTLSAALRDYRRRMYDKPATLSQVEAIERQLREAKPLFNTEDERDGESSHG